MVKKQRKRKPLAKNAQASLLSGRTSSAVQDAPPNGAAAKELQPLHVAPNVWIVLAVMLGAITAWAYWPTFQWMEEQWRHEPDYSHGYIVFPLALVLLYMRMGSFPWSALSVGWGGAGLLVVAVAMRVLGRLAYMDFLDGWSLVPWVAGLVWLLAGRRVMWWALPGIVFLVMLTPMPYRAESLLSFKLQGISTLLSAATLQTLGLAAIPEGNTIWLGERQLMVEEACSGLRIFMGMVAMGFFFAVLSERSWLDRVIIVASCFPIAIFVNVLRVTGTGLAFHWLSPTWAHQAHDLLGVLMIGAGAMMLFCVKRFWEELYRPLEIAMIQRQLGGSLP